MPRLYQKLIKDKVAIFSMVILVLALICTFLAPLIAPYNPYEQNLAERRKAPNSRHWLGTDEFGRDILSRIIYGAKNTLIIGVLSVMIGLLIGSLLGLIAGYYGGLIDIGIMRFIDLMLAFPYFLLAILIVATLGPGMINSTIAIGIATVPDYARVVRGAVLTIRGKLFIQAEVAIGSGDFRIIFGHVLPNVFAPIIVLATLRLASAVLGGAGLGFLGLGTQPPNPEWGVMLSGGRSFLIDAPHISLFPGIALALLVLSFNLFGDALRDYLDPRLRNI